MKINRETVLTATVFILIAIVLIIIEARPNFPDPDSFFHAKMAVIIRDQGFIKTFPWFQWTSSFRETFVDSHLLYHILLIPFVTFFDPLVGIKISAVVFGLLAFFAIYRFLQYLKVPWPAFIVLAAALSQGFLFRISLPRAPAISIVMLLLVTWAILERRKILLFFSTLFFVWLYYSWPIIYLSLITTLLAQFVTEFFSSTPKIKEVLKKIWQNNYSIFGILIAGTVAGLIINPYFPQNIIYTFFAVKKISLIDYQSAFPSVGQEWFPALPKDLILSILPLLVVSVFSFILFLPGLLVSKLAENKKYIYQLFFLIFLTGIYFLLTLKSNRFIEYLTPFLALTAGLFLKNAWPFLQKEIWPIISNSQKTKIVFIILLLLSVFSFSAMTISYTTSKSDYYQTSQYSIATDWIKIHVPAKEIIFHNVWDYSCVLWYLDDTHYYLIGLDPTMMYEFDPQATNLWMDLSNGDDPDVSQIKTFFKSNVVVVDLRMETAKNFIKNLEQSGLFKKVTSNQWIEVFATLELVQSEKL